MIAKRTPTPHESDSSPQNGAGPFAPWAMVRRLTRQQWLYLPRLFSRQEKIRIGALAAVSALALAGLGGRLIAGVTVERPAVGGVLREGAVSEPRFINPIYATSDTDRDLSNLVFAKLIRYEGATQAMDLAEAVEVSPDGKTYTLHLKAGLKWHDGDPLTADDVVFTIKTIQDPEYQSPLRQNWQGVVVEKLGEATVRLTLRQPYAPFYENLALGILPEHLWRKIPRETAVLSDLNLKPVGSGPYRFRRFTRREDGTITSLSLVRNRRYHLAGPYLEEIRFFFYADEERLVAAYRRNEIDGFAFRSATHRESLIPLDLSIYEFRPPKVFAVFLNAGAAPALGRKAVRHALDAAVDREAIVAETAGGGVAVHTPIPPGAFGFNAAVPPTVFNPDASRRLLAADGWKDADGDGALERTEGSGRRRQTQKLGLTIATSDDPELTRVAERIAAMWRAIEVRVEVRAMPISELELTMIRPRAYEALLFGEIFGHDPDPFAFWHTSQLKDPGLNVALYSNRQVDQLLEEARRTSDPGARERKYREFQRIVSEDAGAIFLYSPAHYYALRRTTRGVALEGAVLPEERFNAVNRWYQDTRRALK